MLLMIDNYDSFTWNLVHYLQALGAEVKVIRNDELSVDAIEALAPERIVISPGPCTPNEAGVSVDVIRQLGARTPILGVCLGHQGIGQAYGGDVVRAKTIMPARHRASARWSGVFNDLPDGSSHALHRWWCRGETLLVTEINEWNDNAEDVRMNPACAPASYVQGVQFPRVDRTSTGMRCEISGTMICKGPLFL